MNDEVTIVSDAEPSTSVASVASLSLAPRSVGRYLLIEEIGKGGMGTVHSAFDPELERRVAIKLIYANKEPQARLRREAQAIARVTHANVISVYDVGEFELADRRGVFMVMEMLEGADLRRWTSERKRSVDELFAVYIQAGRGLAAAHDKGVIHRDFKPANVMVANDGRVVVLDFGLARGVDEFEIHEPDDAREGETLDSASASGSIPAGSITASRSFSLGRSSKLSAPLTRHGAVLGTPRFMSPEQHQTNLVDARSDQYSFCLSLYIDLFRRIPFDESSSKTLVRDKLAGVTDWDSDKVPAHVGAALRRGLDPDPERRWPTMASLVDALADDPRARWRRRVAIGLITTASLGVIAGVLVSDQRALARCEQQQAWIADVWGPDQRDAVTEAFASIDRPYAGKASERTLAELDRYAEALAASRASSCADEHRDRIDPRVFVARTACLDERHDRLGSVVDRLADADARLVEHAVDVLGALPPIEPCASVESHAPLTDVDPEQLWREPDGPQKLDAIESELFEIELIAAAGDQADALARIEPVIEQARVLDEPHTLALALLRGGDLHASARNEARAEALLSEAALLAERHDDHDIAIDALLGLAQVLGDMRGRWDDAQRTLDFAKAKYARKPGGTSGEWRLHYAQAGIYNQDRRDAEALAEGELAVASARADQPPMVLAKTLHALAMTETLAKKLDLAEAHARESIDLRVSVYGPDHPSLMYPLRALAKISADRDAPEQALVYLDRAIELGEARHGRDAAGLVEPHTDKAKVLRQMGRFEDALAQYDEALRLHRVNRKSAEDVLRLQSQLQLRLGRPEQALASAERALTEHREAHGDDEQVPWLRSRFIMTRGEALLGLGRADEALRDFRRATELRALEKADDLMLRIWTGEGESLLALGDREGARAVFERARVHRDAGHEDGPLVDAQLDLGLAKTAIDEQQRARWAESAIASFQRAGDRELAAGVRSWLAEQVPSPHE